MKKKTEQNEMNIDSWHHAQIIFDLWYDQTAETIKSSDSQNESYTKYPRRRVSDGFAVSASPTQYNRIPFSFYLNRNLVQLQRYGNKVHKKKGLLLMDQNF